MIADRPPRVGISACLLGETVRHDSGHKRDPFLVDTLGQCVEWVPVCPEVELGLGTPREPIQLVQRVDVDVRLVTVETRVDLTSAMRAYAVRRVETLAREGLAGYVLKKDSPSCGMEGVPVWRDGAPPRSVGRGLFADELMRLWPELPIEDEDRLRDPHRLEQFLVRVFAYRRTQA